MGIRAPAECVSSAPSPRCNTTLPQPAPPPILPPAPGNTSTFNFWLWTQQQTGQNWTPHVQISGCSDLSARASVRSYSSELLQWASCTAAGPVTDILTHNAGDGLLLYVQRRSHVYMFSVCVPENKLCVHACMQTAGPRAARPTQCRSLGLSADRKQVRRLLQTCGSVQIHHTALHLTWQATHFIFVHAGLMFSASLRRWILFTVNRVGMQSQLWGTLLLVSDNNNKKSLEFWSWCE